MPGRVVGEMHLKYKLIGRNKTPTKINSWILLETSSKFKPKANQAKCSQLVSIQFWSFKPGMIRLEWTSNHQCTSWGWGWSSRFGDESKTHPPLPRPKFLVFSAYSLPQIFFPPTYLPPTYLPPTTSLPPTSPHFAPTPLLELEGAWSGKAEWKVSSRSVEVAARSRRVELAVKSGRAKVATRNKRDEVAVRTMSLKQESKVTSQIENLKVSSLPSLHFFLLFSCVVLVQQKRRQQLDAITFFFMFEKKKTTTMCHCLLLWFCYNEKHDNIKLSLPFSVCFRIRKRRR